MFFLALFSTCLAAWSSVQTYAGELIAGSRSFFLASLPFFKTKGTACTEANTIVMIASNTGAGTCNPVACLCNAGQCLQTTCTPNPPTIPPSLVGWVTYSASTTCQNANANAFAGYGAALSCVATPSTSYKIGCSNGAATLQTFTGNGCTTNPASTTTYNPGCAAAGGNSIQTTCSSFAGSPSLTTATLTITFASTLTAQQLATLKFLIELYSSVSVTITASQPAGTYTAVLTGTNAGAGANGIIANAVINAAFFNQQNSTVPAVVRVAGASILAGAWMLLLAIIMFVL